jgi:hypothetical protein
MKKLPDKKKCRNLPKSVHLENLNRLALWALKPPTNENGLQLALSTKTGQPVKPKVLYGLPRLGPVWLLNVPLFFPF